MGMKKMTTDQAEFFELLEQSASNLKVSNVAHESFINVQEDGTEAAAAGSSKHSNCACDIIIIHSRFQSSSKV